MDSLHHFLNAVFDMDIFLDQEHLVILSPLEKILNSANTSFFRLLALWLLIYSHPGIISLQCYNIFFSSHMFFCSEFKNLSYS